MIRLHFPFILKRTFSHPPTLPNTPQQEGAQHPLAGRPATGTKLASSIGRTLPAAGVKSHSMQMHTLMRRTSGRRKPRTLHQGGYPAPPWKTWSEVPGISSGKTVADSGVVHGFGMQGPKCGETGGWGSTRGDWRGSGSGAVGKTHRCARRAGRS